MSDIAKNCVVNLNLADFANTDGAGKVNVIGAGVSVLGVDVSQGLSARFTLWVNVQVPSSYCPAEFPVEVALLDGKGDLIALPGPVDGATQPLRIGQVVHVERPSATLSPGIRDHIGSQVQMVFDFSNGLPLAIGGLYEWRVRVDGDDTIEWRYPFAVAGPPPGPVIG